MGMGNLFSLTRVAEQCGKVQTSILKYMTLSDFHQIPVVLPLHVFSLHMGLVQFLPKSSKLPLVGGQVD